MNIQASACFKKIHECSKYMYLNQPLQSISMYLCFLCVLFQTNPFTKLIVFCSSLFHRVIENGKETTTVFNENDVLKCKTVRDMGYR